MIEIKKLRGSRKFRSGMQERDVLEGSVQLDRD